MSQKINNPVKLKCTHCGGDIDEFGYKGLIEKPYHRWCWLAHKESVLAEVVRSRRDQNEQKRDTTGKDGVQTRADILLFQIRFHSEMYYT